MSKYKFLASELNLGFNSINPEMENPHGLMVIEKNGKKFFKTIPERSTSDTQYKLSFCEIIFDVKTGKVFFQPTAESAAANPRYAMIVPPSWGEEDNATDLLVKKLRKIANDNDRFFNCGGPIQGFYTRVYEKDAIQMAKDKGYKKFYCIGGQDDVFSVKIPKKLEPELGSIDQIRKNAVIQALKEKRSVSYVFGSTIILTLDEAKKLAPHYIQQLLTDLDHYGRELSKKITRTNDEINEIVSALNNN